MRTISIFILSFLFLGCHAEEYPYKGGMIYYDTPQDLPKGVPACGYTEDPLEWEATSCIENSNGQCCYWREQNISPSGTKMLDCRHDWCYNKYECEWHHVISKCEGES